MRQFRKFRHCGTPLRRTLRARPGRYSGWWLNTWYGNSKGAIEEQTVSPVDSTLGIQLDADGQE